MELLLALARGADHADARSALLQWRSELIRGRATFHGRPIFGYGSTPSGFPPSSGRNVYLDTYRGGSWKRMMGVLTRRPTGFFRLGIRPHRRGTAYRGRISGPNWGRTLAPDAEVLDTLRPLASA